MRFAGEIAFHSVGISMASHLYEAADAASWIEELRILRHRYRTQPFYLIVVSMPLSYIEVNRASYSLCEMPCASPAFPVL
jgi:hypothetical protein